MNCVYCREQMVGNTNVHQCGQSTVQLYCIQQKDTVWGEQRDRQTDRQLLLLSAQELADI